MSSRDSVEATVIGTGFGGAVAACRLSQAGFAPLVLERGRRYEADDFPVLPPHDGFLPDTRRLAWGPNQGIVDIQDLDEIVSVQAAGYGGGSLLYANVHLRPRPDIFEETVEHEDGRHYRRWPPGYSRIALDPFYDLAASMLDAAPITAHLDPSMLVKADQFRRAVSALHREEALFHPPLAISRTTGPNPYGQMQNACVHCGACSMGCPHRAKNTLDHNYLAIAEAHGARIRTQCEVLEIERDASSGLYRVHYIDHLAAERTCAETKFLFLCAGAVHTTRLLATATLNLGKEQDRRLKSRVGLGYWPNADAAGVVFDTTNRQFPSWGPAITSAVVFQDRQSTDETRGWFMIQDGGYARELERAIGLFRSPVWGGRNRYPKPATGAVVGASQGEPPVQALRTGAPPLLSPLDAILASWGSAALDRAVPQQLADSYKKHIGKDLRKILPAIVDDTIERTLHHRFQWWLSVLGGPESRWSQLFLSLMRRIARILGTSEEIAEQAQSSLLHLVGLSSPTEVATRLLGYSDDQPDYRTMLLAMGPDSTPGVLRHEGGRLSADLDLYHLAPRYLDEELAMRDIATVLGGELRVNPSWAFLGKPITVHSQGGCRLSDTPDLGVADPNGQVWDCPGLFVIDGASLCSSVGANPSATIAAIAERNILQFIRSQRGSDWPEGDDTRGAQQYRHQQYEAGRWKERADEGKWAIEPPKVVKADYRNKPIGFAFNERMQGFHADLSDPKIDGESRGAVEQKVDEAYRILEGRGRPSYPLEVHVTAHVENLARFFEDETHRMELTGTVCGRLPDGAGVGTFAVKEGSLTLFGVIENGGNRKLVSIRHKKRALTDSCAIDAQKKIAGSYTSSRDEPPRERLMCYTLDFDDGRGADWRLEGYKRIKNDPGFDAWRDTTTLFVRLFSGGVLRSAGAIHVDLPGFFDQLQSMRIVSGGTQPMPEPDPARVAWALLSFGQFFFGNLQRIYAPSLGTALESLLRGPGHGSRS